LKLTKLPTVQHAFNYCFHTLQMNNNNAHFIYIEMVFVRI